MLHRVLTSALIRAAELIALLLVVGTVLFFLLRLAGDPAAVLAGQGATPEQIIAIRQAYGLDGPLLAQYLTYLRQLAVLDFGTSLASGEPALGKVLHHLPVTLLLASAALALSILLGLGTGVFLGARTGRNDGRIASLLLFVVQGVPGYVVALLLINLFAVQLHWLPPFGVVNWRGWFLPTLALAAFLAPKIARVTAANLQEALREDYVRLAYATGAAPRTVLWRHALPNALLGATALAGTQLAFLLSGSVVTESIFVVPGMGWLLIQSARSLDFPVLQALTAVVATMVFLINLGTDALFRHLDPRLRKQQR
ncbi:ABC transporter permease [Roseiterribacter gracilis]|uniref:ABC transporter permease n=1 Tax=Roseiterribacter gracilis TaxID=2812848 RepID=UPI003B429E64